MNRKTTTIIVTLAAVLLFSTVGMASAVIIDGHNITFLSNTTDEVNGTSTWCYNVTSSSSGAALSHWVLCWCNGSAVVDGPDYSYGPDPPTGMTGIKFDDEYGDGESRDVCFTLYGDYPKALINVSIKEGNDRTGDSMVGYGWVMGPVDSIYCPGCMVPELSTSILVSVGLLTLVGYFALRRKD